MPLHVVTAGESPWPWPDLRRRGPPGGPRARPGVDRRRHGAPPARPRPRRADEDRARHRPGHRGRPPRPHAGRPGGAAGHQPRLRQLGGADEPVAGGGGGAGGAPAAPGPRRPRRACRSSASPTCATCSSGPAPGRPRRAWPAARWPRRSCARSASRSSRTSPRSASVRAPERDGLVLGGLRRRRRVARCAAWTPTRRGRWSRRSTSCASATSRSAASSSCARSGSSPGLGSHVSWEQRLDGRIGMALLSIQAAKGVGLGDGFDLAGRPGLRGPRRDLLLATSAATTARPTAPAGSRAG